MAARITDWRLTLIRTGEAGSRVGLVLAGEGLSGATVNAKLEGPFCEYARTLKAFYFFRPGAPATDALATLAAEIPESNLWEPGHPFLYRVTIDVVDERSKPAVFDPPLPAGLALGLRSLRIDAGGLQLNARPLKLSGIALPAGATQEPWGLGNAGCPMLWNPRESGWYYGNRYGPFSVVTLSARNAVKQVKNAITSPTSALWILGDDLDDNAAEQLRKLDSTNLFARVWNDSSRSRKAPPDVWIVEGSAATVRSTARSVPGPVLAVCPPSDAAARELVEEFSRGILTGADADTVTEREDRLQALEGKWSAALAPLDEALGELPNLIGRVIDARR